MKNIALITGAFALIGGCASLPGGPNQPMAAYDDGVDAQKVTAINNASRGRGISIHWVNYPQRRSSASTAAAPSGEPAGF